MRATIASAFIGLSLLFTPASQAAYLSPQWELSGFSQPESVCVSAAHQWLYVSNVNGQEPGFISRLSKDGQLDQLKWVDGLETPTGMGMFKDRLYVADSVQVHVINLKTGKIIKNIKAKDAVMLNDLTISEKGEVFISDVATGKIYTLKDDKLSVWFANPKLPHTNGLLAQGNTLIAANMASKLAQQFDKEEFGSIYKINMSDKSFEMINSSYKLGGLDGVAELNDNIIVSHFPAGEIYQISDNERILLGKVDISAADINVDKSTNTLYIPFLFKGKVASFKIIQNEK